MWAAESRAFYQSIGIADTIPLVGKQPIASAWQSAPVDQQWRWARRDANIGLRHGGGMAAVDADNKTNPTTFDHVMAGLIGLGITNPPIVQTASRIGRHVYVTVTDLPNSVAYRTLSREVGAGELRFGAGALSVLPESIIGGNTYALIAGDWRCIPVVQWRDLLWLLPMQRIVTPGETLPVRLNYRPLTPRVESLFAAIAKAERGDAVGKYPSRSEAEAAITSVLILNGWTFDDIRREFERRMIGHYADARRYRVNYLANTYANALGAIMANPIRRSLAVDYGAAEMAAWPGRTGISDRATYLALLSECYRAGAIETTVSVREVAEHASLAVGTAHTALLRLSKAELIQRVRGANESGELASTWKLLGVINRTRVTDKYVFIYRHPAWLESGATVTPVHLSTPAELTSRQALGPSAVAVYQRLDAMNAKRVTKLACETGRARSTAAAALERLQLHKLAVMTRDGWIAGTNDLQSVADDFGCDALAAARRMKHAEQRAKFREWKTRQIEASRRGR